jgi:hypothetical protein
MTGGLRTAICQKFARKHAQQSYEHGAWQLPIQAGLPGCLGQRVFALVERRMRLGVVQQCVARVGTSGGALLSWDQMGGE